VTSLANLDPAPDAVAETERWFVARGIPHFIFQYSASRDVLTRAVPLLGLIFVVEVVGALNLEWPWWLNVLAALGGVAILVGGLAVGNRLRHRPALARPQRIGPPDLAVFVLVPPILPLVFGGQVRSAVLTAGFNIALVGGTYLVTSYGIVPMTRWGLGRSARQVGDLFNLLVRALPLLLLFVTFLFVNAEVWQVSASLTGPFFWVTVMLFVVIGVVFVVTRLPREIGDLATFESDDELRRLVAPTPASALTPRRPVTPAPSLSRKEWGNVGLVVLFSQGLQIAFVAVLIGAFFVAFGLITMRVPTIEAWTGGSAHVLADWRLWGQPVPLTEELLRVAGFLAAFSGLYFTVVALTDETYRREFYEDVVAEVHEVFAVRAVYLAAVLPPPDPT